MTDYAFQTFADHPEKVAGHVLEQFRRSRVFGAILDLVAEQVSQLDAALFDVLDKRLVQHAAGAQLDVIGAIVKVPRRGRTDAGYRLGINAQLAIFRSSGTIPELENVSALAILAAGADFNAGIVERPPARVAIDLDYAATSSDLVLAYVEQMARAKAAGVALEVRYSASPENTVFRLSDGSVTDADRGFQDGAAGATGGRLAGLAVGKV